MASDLERKRMKSGSGVSLGQVIPPKDIERHEEEKGKIRNVDKIAGDKTAGPDQLKVVTQKDVGKETAKLGRNPRGALRSRRAVRLRFDRRDRGTDSAGT